MKLHLNIALCAGLILTMPSIQAGQSTQKNEWAAFAKERMIDTYLFANRVCDSDLFLVWPILGGAVGYDFEQAIDLFLKVNAGRLLINLAAQQFGQMNQAESSLRAGFIVRLMNSLVFKGITRAS